MLVRSFSSLALALACACSADVQSPPSPTAAPPAPREASVPPLDPTNIVSIASASPDHTKLVAALRAANYVTSVANPGPLTVFAPTDAAFAALPAGTLDQLLRADHATELKEVLKYHVAASVYDAAALRALAGKQLAMANGKKVPITVAGDELRVGGARVVATVRASNGIVHVVDAVLLPPTN